MTRSSTEQTEIVSLCLFMCPSGKTIFVNQKGKNFSSVEFLLSNKKWEAISLLQNLNECSLDALFRGSSLDFNLDKELPQE